MATSFWMLHLTTPGKIGSKWMERLHLPTWTQAAWTCLVRPGDLMHPGHSTSIRSQRVRWRVISLQQSMPGNMAPSRRKCTFKQWSIFLVKTKIWTNWAQVRTIWGAWKISTGLYSHGSIFYAFGIERRCERWGRRWWTKRRQERGRATGSSRSLKEAKLYIVKGSLEVKLPTIWRVEKQSREVESEDEKQRGEVESEERRYNCQLRESQKKRDPHARNVRKVVKCCVFLMICGSAGSK